ncbi:MAG: LPS assembly lipoprotein LptE [Endomicrobia bacterium]|nr:LPS assembly lipoprotein LptE [Endomicrobiia bacterium]MCL2507000.1 LPS assembly lipoprotein LptE [Endomicrobiia bacterium]
MKKALLYLSLCMIFVLTSCASIYDPAPQILPEHIRNVFIRPITNNTNQFGLEARFTNALVDEILRDGRLSVVNSEDEANGMLSITIRRYILQPLTYDVNMVAEQFKLWIIVSVSFIDRENNVTLWTEPNMEGIQIYRDITNRSTTDFSMGEGMTEEDARTFIWEKLSRDIVKRTIRGFGSVTSVSERKVPI